MWPPTDSWFGHQTRRVGPLRPRFGSRFLLGGDCTFCGAVSRDEGCFGGRRKSRPFNAEARVAYWRKLEVAGRDKRVRTRAIEYFDRFATDRCLRALRIATYWVLGFPVYVAGTSRELYAPAYFMLLANFMLRLLGFGRPSKLYVPATGRDAEPPDWRIRAV